MNFKTELKFNELLKGFEKSPNHYSKINAIGGLTVSIRDIVTDKEVAYMENNSERKVIAFYYRGTEYLVEQRSGNESADYYKKPIKDKLFQDTTPQVINRKLNEFVAEIN